MLAAPGSGASVWANGKPVSGGFAGLVLPFRATAALDLVGCKAVGDELEIFEASVQRGKAPEIIQIGTDQEGDYMNVAETEKGTAGIPRRVGIPAAAALKSVMQKHGTLTCWNSNAFSFGMFWGHIRVCMIHLYFTRPAYNIPPRGMIKNMIVVASRWVARLGNWQQTIERIHPLLLRLQSCECCSHLKVQIQGSPVPKRCYWASLGLQRWKGTCHHAGPSSTGLESPNLELQRLQAVIQSQRAWCQRVPCNLANASRHCGMSGTTNVPHWHHINNSGTFQLWWKWKVTLLASISSIVWVLSLKQTTAVLPPEVPRFEL